MEGERALIITNDRERIIIISDTHVGFEEQLSRRGLHLPSQSARMAERIIRIKRNKSCDSLIILGDVKDSILGLEPKAVSLFNSFIAPLSKEFRQIQIVPGNHDAGLENLLPSSISLTGSRGLMLREKSDNEERRVALLHGHAFPSSGVERADMFVMGHMHLILQMESKAEPVWVRSSFRIEGEEKMKGAIIVPPFNELLTGYMPRREQKGHSFADYVLRNSLHIEALLLDGTELGDPRALGEALAEVEY